MAVYTAGCASRQPPATAAATPRQEASPVQFAYGTTEGGEFSSRTTRGRATAILFVTTFDMACQAAARRLSSALRRVQRRSNAGAVVLEVPAHSILAESFRTSLALPYPVAMADAATQAGGGPFGPIAGVPTVVVLDPRGRLVFRKTGLVEVSELRAALDRAAR